MLKILFVTPEAHPLIKTGGLGDVCGSLPIILQSLGADVRLLLPAYHEARLHAGRLQTIADIPLTRMNGTAKLLEGKLPGAQVKFWLVDYPLAFGRAGHPYLDEHGQPWYDNAARFALFSEVACALAQGQTAIAWRPDVVHCHDWQTALIPALLSVSKPRPATVFTLHNLAYQGLVAPEMFTSLGLPLALWSMHGLEYNGLLSFIKGGLLFSDRLATVSPTYALEIQSPEFGFGLDGLLRARADRLTGILNGIDTAEWNPARDRHLVKPYSLSRFAAKAPNKRALQAAFGLPKKADIPLIGFVGRLVDQKGIDLVLDAWPKLAQLPMQLVMLGTGETQYENTLRHTSVQFPDRLAVKIGYDETLAHRLEAGADLFLMPSHFEPCGLNQMYSMRYGTPPIVRSVGGLADTVTDTTPEAVAKSHATGFTFKDAHPESLIEAVMRALEAYRDPRVWKKIISAGMQQDFSWRKSADKYLALYRRAMRDNLT